MEGGREGKIKEGRWRKGKINRSYALPKIQNSLS